mgnify:CR=1 FL=1
MQTYLFNIIDMPSFKEITFEQFYKLYPNKKARAYAEKLFKKLSIKDRFDAYTGLINYIKVWKASETEKQFIPHPSTFINQRRWEDEIELPKQKAEFKKDGTGRFFVGYCSKCRTSDFYNDYELKGDSRCCKADILPKRK